MKKTRERMESESRREGGGGESFIYDGCKPDLGEVTGKREESRPGARGSQGQGEMEIGVG